MSYDAVGLTAHPAARVAQLAAPGGVRMTADTMRLVDGYVCAEALGPISMKGVPGAVEVDDALRDRTAQRGGDEGAARSHLR